MILFYHQVCRVNFRTSKNVASVYGSENNLENKGLKRGRHSLSDREGLFLEVIKYLEENDDEQVTISDLVQEMESFLLSSDHDAFSSKHMKMRIKEHFGDRIVITNINGKK